MFAFVRFFFFVKKYFLLTQFYLAISLLARPSHTGQKFFKKNFLQRATALFLNIAPIVHTQNFDQYMTVYVADVNLLKCERKSAYLILERTKNVKKRTKN